VENSKDFFNRLKAGEVSGKEIRERLYVATLYVLAVAYVLSGLAVKTVVTHGPALLHSLKKTLSFLADHVPEVTTAQPQNEA
jgi:hypothetical protein